MKRVYVPIEDAQLDRLLVRGDGTHRRAFDPTRGQRVSRRTARKVSTVRRKSEHILRTIDYVTLFTYKLLIRRPLILSCLCLAASHGFEP
jgi:hypothetical protein